MNLLIFFQKNIVDCLMYYNIPFYEHLTKETIDLNKQKP